MLLGKQVNRVRQLIDNLRGDEIHNLILVLNYVLSLNIQLIALCARYLLRKENIKKEKCILNIRVIIRA